MKRICLLAVCLTISSSVFAAVSGPYVGLGAGYGNLRTPNGYAFGDDDGFDPLTANSRGSGGWAGRAFAGFNFNRYVGVEAGWAYYPRAIYKASDVFGDNSSLKYNAKTVDVVVKGYFPIGYTGLSIYALVGGARVSETITFTDGGIASSNTFNFPPPGVTHVYKTRPMYGIGLSYDIPYHFTAAVEFTQIQRLGSFSKNSTPIPFIDLATFQLIYRFT